MNSNGTARRVVVGYVSSGDGDPALDWAQAEAKRREIPLVMLVASGVEYFTAPEMSAVPPWRDEVTAKLVHEAKSYAAKATGVAISVESRPRLPAASLVDASANAELVVVGRHEQSAIGEAFWGSTSAQVAAHGLVRSSSWTVQCAGIPRRPSSWPSTDRIRVVRRSSSPSSGRRMLPLHWWPCTRGGWTFPTICRIPRLPDPMVEGVENGAQTVLDDSLAPWIEKFPDVVVRKILTRQYPVEAVLDAAGNAQVIVVGSRGRGGFVGLLLGSVSQGLLHDTGRACPLVVVHAAD
ncbi:universal stress protein [Janibacter limosus]|uniref:Universal stress protein n=1 Tax=Janibacter limosus TaxID=53458 RepID=A0AC61U389_9MICO|nr:universal stress protein [Janibacter limosus]UUZ44485.1 universal stress protein [Janibacter limosus]